MSSHRTDRFSIFASLHRYFTLIETTKPTPQQAEFAASQLCHVYGAESEEDLLRRGVPELIAMYKEIKHKILSAAM